jgi:hypothetical protein
LSFCTHQSCQMHFFILHPTLSFRVWIERGSVISNDGPPVHAPTRVLCRNLFSFTYLCRSLSGRKKSPGRRGAVVILYTPTTKDCRFDSPAWDRCYDFLNKFNEKNGVFLLKLLLVFEKIVILTLFFEKNANFFAKNWGKSQKIWS